MSSATGLQIGRSGFEPWPESSVVFLVGVYMRKLAPARRVSYRDDFFYFVSRLHYDWVISYLVI